MATSAEKDRLKDNPPDDRDDGEERDDEERDDDKSTSGDADAPAPKPAAKSDAPSKTGGKRPGAAAVKAARAKGAASKAAPVRPVKRQGAMAKSMILFVLIVGVLVVALLVLGKEEGGGGVAQPKWAVGQKVDVEITLVHTDQQDLSCASSDEIGGKHCGFEAKNKPWSKGDPKDDKLLLKPYTTTDRIQFLAAGVWSDTGMTKAPLPKTRFSVKCKFNVEGKLRKPAVRWAGDGPWYDQGGEWYAGSVSDCVIAQ